MRRGKRVLVLLVIAAMGFWTLMQLFGELRKEEAAGDARTLLYEASLFQVELLGGFLNDAAKLTTTSDLDGLKQSVYSAEYTHRKLVKAWGTKLPELHSVSILMEWILRMQMGGQRELKADEKELFASIKPLFQQLYTAYSILLSDSGQIVASQAEELKHSDDAIVRLLEDHMK